MDLLGDILSTLELCSTLCIRAELAARFLAGDLVPVPHGADHVLVDLSSALSTRTRNR